MPYFRRLGAFVRLHLYVFSLFALIVIPGSATAQSVMARFMPGQFDGGVIYRGDINNDGIVDVVTGNNCGVVDECSGVTVYLGKPDGTFHPAMNVGPPALPAFDVALGDFNQDGKLDVALMGYSDPSTAALQILLGKGDGSFDNGQVLNPDGLPGHIVAADFDGDGKIDLALAENASPTILFYKGQGDGTFAGAGTIQFHTSNPIQALRVGDFDNDGKGDLGVLLSGQLSVLWNQGNFTFSKAKIVALSGTIDISVADVNQDGLTDLILTDDDPVPSWEILLSNGRSRSFRTSTTMVLDSLYSAFWQATAIDLNGDGINDIAALTYDEHDVSNGPLQTYEVIAWLGNPDGSYQNTPLKFNTGTSSTTGGMVSADFNRDGRIDLVVVNADPNTAIGALINATARSACQLDAHSPSVTVCRPQDLAFSNSPVRLIAGTTDTDHVTQMKVLIDGQVAFKTSSDSLDKKFQLAPGEHFVMTQAFDDVGRKFRSNRNLTIFNGKAGNTCSASPLAMNICAPNQNAKTPLSVHVFGNAQSDRPITAVQVYIDGSLVFNDTSSSTYVNRHFTVTAGGHQITVKAFDASGRIFSDTRTITAQ